MNAVVYTDASYCDKSDIAACGFVVHVNGRLVKHEISIVSGLKTSVGAEMYALVEGIQFAFMLKGVATIHANSDCKSIVTETNANRISRRVKYGYKDLYETILMLQESGIKFSLRFVRAHFDNKLNRMVDISCRLHLRKYLKQQIA